MKHSRVKTITAALALALLVGATPGTSPALGRSDTTRIVLTGNTIAVEGGGVTVDGSTATITAAGSYDLSGTLAEGRIVVDTDDDGAVTLIFDGADITSESAAPIAITNADEVVIVLADGTTNRVTEGANSASATAETDAPNAAIFSEADLTIQGGGSLTVTSSANDGIASKDDLLIAGGTITVAAADDGIRGKDTLVIQAGTLSVNAGGNGLIADNDTDPTLGTITVVGGTLTVTAGADGLSAQTAIAIADGQFALTAGGGSSGTISGDASAKGIKAAVSVMIDGGSFWIDTADDAINANDSITINGGSFTIATGDDGMHADTALTIANAEVTITGSYEGLESAAITINSGTIRLVASDDGVNVAGGNDGSGMGGPRERGGQAQDTFAAASNGQSLTINGGTLIVDAGGDGFDINGAVTMTGGVVLVSGPTEQMNGALDYDGGFTITGGLLVAAGSAGMAMIPDQSSTQASVLISFNGTLPAGTLVHLQDSAGQDVLTFALSKPAQTLAVSSPALVVGATYEVYTGGSATGTASDGLYADGSYAAGTLSSSVTLTGISTGGGGGFMGGGQGPRRR